MSKHINRNNVKAIACSLWLDELPNPDSIEAQCLKNNAAYFDEFYLLTDKDYEEIDAVFLTEFGVKIKVIHDLREQLLDFLPEHAKSLVDKSNFAMYSDLLCYSCRTILEQEGPVFYIDCDTFIYSKLLVQDILGTVTKEGLYVILDENLKLAYNTDCYPAPNLALDNGTTQRFWDKMNDYLINSTDPKCYTALGPTFLATINPEDASKYDFGVLPLRPHTFNWRTACKGENVIRIQSGSIGVHLAKSIGTDIGMKLNHISRINNEELDLDIV